MQPLQSKIEALLFERGEPVSVNTLATQLAAGREEVIREIKALNEHYKQAGGGFRVAHAADQVCMTTAPEHADLIKRIRKEGLSKDLGRAASEVLAIILYGGPTTRSDIEYIRGVNSTFILRNLLIRGLIERAPDSKDQRSFQYRPTTELLAHLGISSVEELPDFVTVRREIDEFREQTADNKHEGDKRNG